MFSALPWFTDVNPPQRFLNRDVEHEQLKSSVKEAEVPEKAWKRVGTNSVFRWRGWRFWTHENVAQMAETCRNTLTNQHYLTRCAWIPCGSSSSASNATPMASCLGLASAVKGTPRSRTEHMQVQCAVLDLMWETGVRPILIHPQYCRGLV